MKTDQKILNYQQVGSIGGSKKVLVTGCFDILHLGHIIFLEYAKKQGKVLIVGIGSDKTIRKLKGKNRPILSEKIRARTVAALDIVDFVVINKEPLKNGNIDHTILVSKLKPKIYVVPVTDRNLAGKHALVEQYGGKVKTCHRLPPNHLKGGISSTEILKKLCQINQ